MAITYYPYPQTNHYKISMLKELVSNIGVCGTSQVVLVVKSPLANAGDIRDVCLIPGSGRSPGREHGNPL